MLNEPASSAEDRPPVRPVLQKVTDEADSKREEIRQIVSSVFLIEREMFRGDDDLEGEHVMMMSPGSHAVALFEGALTTDSETAYATLDEQLKPINHLALFRNSADNKQVIHILEGRVDPKPRRAWLNIVLFVATVLSVLVVGTEAAISEIAFNNPDAVAPLLENFFFEMWRGLPYAISILLILGAHEMGHYFAARHHKIAVTLPYFIPAPFISFLGTFGAAIQLREPMRNRKVLFDVGAAGPFAGLVFAVPILFIGLATSPTGPITPGGLLEGNSVLYALAKFIVFGEFLPNGEIDVYINQLTRAGWAGLLVTALNLIPLGQLDGGHITYSLFGDFARRLYFPLIAISVGLAFVSQAWIFWVLLLFLLGRVYAVPLDNITPLDKRRRWMAIAAIITFFLIFVPIPLTVVPGADGGGGGGDATPRNTVFMFMTYASIFLPALWLRLRGR